MIFLYVALFLLTLANQIFPQSGMPYRRSGVMDGNQVQTAFGNWGVIGQPGSLGPRGAWKLPSNGYLGDFSIMIGNRLEHNSVPFATVEICPVSRPTLNREESSTGISWGFEPRSLGDNHIAFSNDPATWPADWSVWPFNTDGAFEVYFEMDDNNDTEFNDAEENALGIAFKPDSLNPDRNGMALKIETRYRQFNSYGLEDLLMMEYNIVNEGTTPYKKLVFGGLAGTFVGQSGFTPSGNEYDDDVAFFDIKNSATYFWDFDQNVSRNPLWGGEVGYAALMFIQSPGNPYDGIDNDRDNADLPGSSAPYFTASDFDGHTIQAGEQIVLIDENYNRSLMTVPNDTITVTTCGKTISLIPGITYVAEGIGSTTTDGFDNDFDGLIDENYDLHFNLSAPGLTEPFQIDNTLGPTQYIDYFSMQGLNDPLIDEDGLDVDEIGLTSFEYFVPAGDIDLADDGELMERIQVGFFDIVNSYQNGKFNSGEDGDYLFGSGQFPLRPGEQQKVVLGLVFGNTPDELQSKVQLIRANNFNGDVDIELEFTSIPSGVYDGNVIPITWQSSLAGGTVIVESTADNGSTWQYLDNVPAVSGAYNWDITDVPDGFFYKIRIRHSHNALQVVDSPRFTINHPGPADPQVVFTQEPEFRATVSGNLDINWLAGDADGESVVVFLNYGIIQIDDDTTWHHIAVLPDSGSYTVDTRSLPNSEAVLLRLGTSDGFGTGFDVSPRFIISNVFQTLSNDLFAHIDGTGNGLFRVYIVDTTGLTGHQYVVTFASDAATKTYDVKDLDTGQIVVNGETQLDSMSLGPEFDGVRLLLHDIDPAEPDFNTSRWSNNEINMTYILSTSKVILDPISGEVVQPVPFPHDYQFAFFADIVDTSAVEFRGKRMDFWQPSPAKFRIRNLTNNEYVRFLFVDIDGDATISASEDVSLIEKDDDGIDQLSWRFFFHFHPDSTEWRLPQPGDSLFIKTLKPFTNEDRFQFTTGDRLILGIENDTEYQAVIPEKLQLFQNYPNPFNPSTNIPFAVHKASKVSLIVYDILGRKVKELVNKKHAPGIHKVIWDGKNGANQRVASGVYFTVFRSGENTFVRKMILIR